MSRMVGTVSRGLRAPIIRNGDDIVEIVTNSVLEASADDGFEIRDRDVVAMTEAIVARAQGNYASVDNIADDVRAKLGGETIGVIFPILSRNRFAICLRGFAKGAKKIVLMLSYPSDEVGNHLISLDAMDEKGVDPYKDVLTLEKYTNRLLSGPDIVTRGFVYVRESEMLIDDATGVVYEAVMHCIDNNISDWSKIKSVIKDSLGDYIWKKMKRAPMILPIIMEVS